MKLKTGDYNSLAKRIRDNNSRVIIYGAGMIGRIVVPFIIDTYRLYDYIDCYVDMDGRKTGERISIGYFDYEIRKPEYLDWVSANTVILLTNSKFFPVIDFLEKKESLKNVDCYIIPVMQKREQRSMIPKIIHYCWFGGADLPVFLQNCLESWKEKCPEYEIKRWDEKNFDVSKYPFTRQAFKYGKYGFVSDVARLDILYRNGGIYLDTDVRLLKSFDELLFHKGFVGTERWGNINSGGGIGAVPHHPMIREMLDYRLQFPFVCEDGSFNIETNGLYETIPFVRHGFRIDNTLQIVNDMTVLPASVFHPYDYMSREEKIEADTIGIHYFYGGWMDEEDRRNRSDTQEKYKEILQRMVVV